MTRLSALVVAATLCVSATLAPAAVQARASAPFFTVELAEAASESEAIAGGVLFTCEGTTCVAPRSRERPLRVCRELSREVGTIVSFASGDRALTETQLARCNG